MSSKGNVRIYIRVSTEEQTIERQEHLIDDAKAQGFYIAGVYREKASGAIEDRPELQKLISELQPGDFVVAEKMDRISELTRISRERELTEEEKTERQALREEYLAEWRRGTIETLESLRIEKEDGTIVPLPKKKK